MINKWDKRMMRVAQEISTWSKDDERKVGCVITTNRYRIISTGFNGYPLNIDDTNLSHKLLKTVHAEINALISIPFDKQNLRMYIYGGHPCSQCAATIVQHGITDLFCPAVDVESSWTESMSVAIDIFDQVKSINYNII